MYLDLAKSHLLTILVDKLMGYGLGGASVRWIYGGLSNHIQSVFINAS